MIINNKIWFVVLRSNLTVFLLELETLTFSLYQSNWKTKLLTNDLDRSSISTNVYSFCITSSTLVLTSIIVGQIVYCQSLSGHRSPENFWSPIVMFTRALLMYFIHRILLTSGPVTVQSIAILPAFLSLKCRTSLK